MLKYPVYCFVNNCILREWYSYFENDILFLKKKQEYSKRYSCFSVVSTAFILYFSESLHNIFLLLPHSLPIFNFFCRYFFNLLTFQNPFKINGFPIFFTCYFVDMLTLLLYYNRYSTFCCFLWKFVASWHRYIYFYIRLISILLIIYIFYTYDFHIKRCPDRRYQECICLS